MAKNNVLLPVAIIFVGLLAAVGLYLFPGIIQPGCTLCGWEWTSVGRATDVPVGGVINIGQAIGSYNGLIASSGKVVQGAEAYSSCQFSVYKIARYKQISDNQYRYAIWNNAQSQYISISGTGSASGEGFYFNCPYNYQVILDPSPKSCTMATNPDPASYTEYQECTGLAGVDIYIRSSSIASVQCQAGQTRTRTCPDGSVITSQNCINNLWSATGTSCPSGGTTPPSGGTTPPSGGTTPSCTNTCAENYTRTAYPDCTCIAPQQASVCAVNSVLHGTCNGQQITTYTCVNGQWQPAENCTSTPVPEGTIQPPQTEQPSDAGFIILLVVMFFVLVISVIGVTYLMKKR